MSEVRNRMNRLLMSIEALADGAVRRLLSRFDRDALMIQPYIGYGNSQHIRLRGRVLRDAPIVRSSRPDSLWRNLLNSYHRFATDEVPFATVRAVAGDQAVTATADEEGFFLVDLPLPTPVAVGQTRLELALTVTAVPHPRPGESLPTVRVTALVPGTDARFGVISDVDDTVLQSSALNWFKLARNTFLRGAHGRQSFKGVPGFYRALQQGLHADGNPIYYLSSSPWNLYDLITHFFSLQGLPEGPLFLQDIGLGRDQFITREHSDHKLAHIREILDMHPHLPFVLIGDSGQHDPEIYAHAVLDHPGRILAIYIRDVTHSASRTAQIRALASQFQSVSMQLVPDTEAAARHALQLGLIDAEAVELILAEF